MEPISKNIFFEASYVTVYWCERGYVYVDWCGYVSSEQVKEGCEKLLKCCISINSTGFINDNRKVKGTWNQSLQWLESEFIPRLIAHDIKKIAFIYSPEQSARYSVNRLLEITCQYDGQTFENFEDAAEWLIGQRITDNSDMLAIQYRGIAHQIPFSEILYISKMERKLLIQTTNQQYSYRSSLQDILAELPQDKFFRIHKSYIVNVTRIAHLKYHAGGYYRLYIKELGNAYLTVSKLYVKQLKELQKGLLQK